ncbi:hypothetical protein C8J57DRAFT_1539370 [Mycena rebaudengoi]|nr:hypothetical protein C8J57DRAFT_1539370 [Mycena rebaudengoi]
MLSSPDLTTGIPFAPTPHLRSASAAHLPTLLIYLTPICLQLRANIPSKHLRSHTSSVAGSLYSLRGGAQSHLIHKNKFLAGAPRVQPASAGFQCINTPRRSRIDELRW